MNLFLLILLTLGIALSGYLVGSLSWAIIITRVFFHIDLRKVGSGNAGGTNVGRALGTKWAVITILLDIGKCLLPLWTWFFVLTSSPLGSWVSAQIGSFPLSFFYYLGGFSASLGHIFPLYFRFKGGKAVSCFGGFVLGTNWLLMVGGLSVFLLTLKAHKRVSFSSLSGTVFVMTGAILLSVLSYFYPDMISLFFWFLPGPKFDASTMYACYIVLYGSEVIFLHHANIDRLKHHKEPETHFRKKGEDIQLNYDSGDQK